MMLVSLDGENAVIEAIDNLKTGTPRAIMRGLNRAIGSARTIEVKGISGDTGMKQADVRDALTMTTATQTKPEASLSAGMKRIPLIDFKATGPEPSRGKGGGVRYVLQGGRDQLPDAFIATMSSGHRGVFERVGSKRLPIRELYGPSLGKVFFKFRPDAIARAEEIFATNFEHEMTDAFAGTPVPTDPGIDA